MDTSIEWKGHENNLVLVPKKTIPILHLWIKDRKKDVSYKASL